MTSISRFLILRVGLGKGPSDARSRLTYRQAPSLALWHGTAESFIEGGSGPLEASSESEPCGNGSHGRL
jgi:hypothetical protein